ncbi:tRNA pseudouridine(55) synthase TruB [Prosthecochloris sp. N3]|uniref:tRNA pseudouridine synthase B n=1 Tax=Prosthecochloris ethylica TaxID=2743976 RepID=A0ABR9XRW8_9CHLB|nr:MULTISPECIES: tRNA pseudouridine(55) synthase TruB [Prosthecochloris]MEC9487163.1 tRNA pseudouridine(55) synthase TruB [Prosthecochloris sp.]MBF0586857.1 tRNA pseudouridine(55) synthase TruB [Prosthecochloris ethylica]MBF0636795.1 tRNA pseudouridine(55) synthase TruB [Prosthecochloris ethylica]NUK48011.1 tRNA pseudouridine(55) synthase TruB [Prosthecochloris ethylica]RNA64303.1 tRNA pseudouridine(55) synthase TruB [Prosthecochloris sp. ZM_2]
MIGGEQNPAGRQLSVASEDGDFLLVDKPFGWTSFDVVAKIRNAYTRAGLRRKVGHCGTLDPMASGLLILASGKKTKKISTLEVLDKGYEGSIRLGVQTESHDSETPEYGHCSLEHLAPETIREAANRVPGTRLQQPPMHSAAWHQGKRLYELARKGKSVRERRAREITVYRFDITGIDLPDVHFSTDVSKGAYIRVIAHDFGEALGVGGYLKALRRVSIGEYRLSEAFSVEAVVSAIEEAGKEAGA